MSDITIRLRKWFKAVDAVPAIDLMDEAANVIESLRTEIRTQRKEIAAMRAEQAVVQGADIPADCCCFVARYAGLTKDSLSQFSRMVGTTVRISGIDWLVTHASYDNCSGVLTGELRFEAATVAIDLGNGQQLKLYQETDIRDVVSLGNGTTIKPMPVQNASPYYFRVRDA